jgi:hypothetical protein
MENGLPASGTLTFLQDPPSHVYDLVAGVEVPVGNDHRIALTLGPCDGRLLMGLPRPIHSVTVNAPASVKPGERVSLEVSVNDPAGSPLPAVIPLRLEIRDANGRLAEGSGYHAAENGRFSLALDLAPNEDPGTWEITVRELASRKSAMAAMRVGPSLPHP